MQSHQIPTIIIILINFQMNGYKQEKIPSTCGRREIHYEALITNGLQSRKGEWPWHAAIYHVSINDLKYKCGGSVLNSNSILTAAHCMFENNRLIIPDRVFVQLGKFRLLDSGTQDFDVIRVYFFLE